MALFWILMWCFLQLLTFASTTSEASGSELCRISSSNMSCTDATTRSWCQAYNDATILCPKVDDLTLCETIAQRHATILAQMDACPAGIVPIPAIVIESVGRASFFSELFQLNHTHERFSVRNARGGYICTIATLDNKVVKKYVHAQFGGYFNFPEDIFDTTDVWKLECTHENAAKVQSRLRIFLITLGGNITLTEIKSDNNSAYTDTITCSLRSLPTDNFQLSYAWSRNNEKINHRFTLNALPTGEPNATTTGFVENTGGNSREIGIIVGSVVSTSIIAILAIVGLIAWTKFKKRRESTQRKADEEVSMEEIAETVPQPDLLLQGRIPDDKLYEISKCLYAYDKVSFGNWADRRIALADSAEADNELQQFQQWGEQSDAFPIRPSDPSDPNYCNVTDTARKCNTSALRDFYRRRILIGPAPTRQMLLDHLEMIHENKVGVIILIDDPPSAACVYAASKVGKQSRCGRFRIETKNIMSRIAGCSVYSLIVHCRNTESRNMTLIHVKSLEDRSSTMVETVKQAHAVHPERIEEDSPTLLIQDSNGLCASVSTVCAYICYQMYNHAGTLAPMAVIRYIRQHRELALSCRVLSVHIVNAELAAVAMALTELLSRS